MAKAAKNEAPGPNSAANRDIIQRLNFLYQASVFLNSINSLSNASSTSSTQPYRKPKSRPKIARLNDVSKSYIDTMKVVGTKTTVKTDPSVKRTLCKVCNAVLIPGTTVLVRTKKSSSHGHAISYTCMSCKLSRRIPAASILKSEKPISGNPEPMETDAPASETQKRKRKNTSRSLPLFAKTGEHVVYCGNERIDEDLVLGNGIYTV